MTKTVFILFVVLVASFSLFAENEYVYAAEHNINRYPAACNKPAQTVTLTGKSCDNYVFDPVQISCLLPENVQDKLQQNNFNNRQRASDLFSWQSFVAYNWPASKRKRGLPDASLPIDSKRERVWETWKETAEIFLDSGKRPANWDKVQPLKSLTKTCKAGSKLLYRNQKVAEELSLNNVLQPTKANTLPGTLTSQQGQVVHYEIRYNKTAFDYIVNNKLYSAKHQNIINEVEFPAGSTLVKAAWLPLKDTQRASHFLSIEACVCDPKKSNKDPFKGCKNETVGLVGFHVMRKTEGAPQWIWSTFEQIDNVKPTSGISASFNNPGCIKDGKPCADNQQTEPGVPNQVARSIKIPDTQTCMSDHATDNVALLNKNMQRALAKRNTPLQFYELVNSQWPVVDPRGSNQPETVFTPLPALLGNTTLETFVQPTSSCMGCHAMARSARQDRFVSADFTFTLDNAKPDQSDPYILLKPCNPYIPPKPSNPCIPLKPTENNVDKSVWHGFRVMENTYEMLPDKVNAKLHCSSCHLDAGRNPSASWLVDMETTYAMVEARNKSGVLVYPQSLYARINGCFQRSMNGQPLCKVNENCESNKAMQGLRNYTEWLTVQRDKILDSDSPRGFPQLLSLEGDSERGKATYLQKCAFCHGENGEGRYGHDKYYRPALWGKNSYNDCAGMAKTPAPGKGTHLAGFIKANMPLHSGGVLTDQEAWDLATYINSHCRPGKANCSKELYPVSASCSAGTEQANPHILPVRE